MSAPPGSSAPDPGNRQGTPRVPPQRRKQATNIRPQSDQSRQFDMPEPPQTVSAGYSETVLEPAATPPIQLGQGPTSTERLARKDALKREKITAALVQLLTGRTNVAPFAIGLFGHWGSGKSSQIGFVKTALENVAAPRIRFAEFNAWEHESCDNMGAALAQKIVEALVKDLSFFQRCTLAARIAMQRKSHLSAALTRDRHGALAALTKLTHTAAPLLVPAAVTAFIAYLILDSTLPRLAEWGTVGAGLLTLGLSTQSFVSKNLTDWFKSLNTESNRSLFQLPDYTSKLGSFHDIHTTLRHLCALHLAGDDALPARGDYLFLIVDDLDRCSPQAVKQVFDAVRLVANINRVVTLVALDERIAFAAVEKHFDQFDGAGRSTAQVARDYLAKVFQVAISLPPVSPEASSTFIKEKLFEDYLPPTEPAGSAPAPSLPVEAGLTVHVHQDEIALFAALAEATHMVNPRQLSRLKQAWFLLRGIVLNDGDALAAMAPWMQSLFCREWLLQESVETRAALEAAVRSGKELPLDAAALPVHRLLNDERAGWKAHWATVDAVLLPARTLAGPRP